MIKKSTILSSAIATVVIGLIGTSTAVWASGKTPEISHQVDEGNVLSEEEFNELYQLDEEMVEMEWIPESEATKEQIEAHQQLFDALDANEDFWADVEEDSILINDPTTNVDIINEVELEAGVLVEVK